MWLAFDGDSTADLKGATLFADELDARRYAMDKGDFDDPVVVPVEFGRPLGEYVLEFHLRSANQISDGGTR